MVNSVVLLVALFGLSSAYVCQHCDGNMCCNIPSDSKYYLTSFCAGYPHAGVSCGGYCDNQGRYFTADRQRFGCGGYLNLCRNGKCVRAKIIDAGPASFVEEDAGMPIIDASPDVCQYLTGGSSCGWSDRFLITATKAFGTYDDSQLGPFNVTAEEYDRIVKGLPLIS